MLSYLTPTVLEFIDGLYTVNTTVLSEVTKMSQTVILVEEVVSLFTAHWRPTSRFFYLFR